MTVSVCFVCLGNICRSPTAEGVMKHLVQRAGLEDSVRIDSAGTAAYHAGEPPDRRSAAAAQARGTPLGGKARQFRSADFSRFDYVVAMDTTNHADLLDLASKHDGAESRVFLLRDFDPASPNGSSVPDPYYGGDAGFEEVLDLCEAACQALLGHLIERHRLPT